MVHPSTFRSGFYLRQLFTQEYQVRFTEWYRSVVLPVIRESGIAPMATIVLELFSARAKTQTGFRSQVFHLNNPYDADWAVLLPMVPKRLSTKVVLLEQWIQTLEQTPVSHDEITKKPALKLLDFWKMVSVSPMVEASLSTEVTATASQTMRNLKPADLQLLDLYLRQLGLY